MASEAYKADNEKAKAAAYRGPVNPFEPGTRPYRLYLKWRAHHDRMEGDFAEMAMVHGHPWPPEGASLRHPPVSIEEARAAPRTPENEAALADMEWWRAQLPKGLTLHTHTGRQHAYVMDPDGKLAMADGARLAALVEQAAH